MQNTAMQPQPEEWALANKLRYCPQGQGLCLTPEWPLFSWPAPGGKWSTKRTFSALRWHHHDGTVTQRCSIIEGSHDAPSTPLVLPFASPITLDELPQRLRRHFL